MASKRKTMVQTMENNPRKCESSPLCWGIEIHKQYRCGSKPIIDNFSGMNIHVSVILEFTRYQAFDPDWSKVVQSDWRRKYRGMCQQAAWKFLVDCGPGGYNPPRFHGSWLMSPFFTSPNHEWYMVNAMAIFSGDVLYIPKMGQANQPLLCAETVSLQCSGGPHVVTSMEWWEL